MTYTELWQRLTPLYDDGEARAIARWVLDVRFGLTTTDIICGKDTELSANDQTELEKIAQRLEKGEPVQYVLGVADFCGRQFHVAPGVLIPRPETAELIEWIIDSEKRKENNEQCRVLDIGTGSGCIAITLALDIPESEVTAWDISDDALRIAATNATALGADVVFEKRDILDSSLLTLHSSLFTTIVSNPPYIQPSERDGMEKNVLDYEPALALFAPEERPTLFYEHIADYATTHLTPGGALYLELNPLTADAVATYILQLGFHDVEILQDQYGRQRFLKAMKI